MNGLFRQMAQLFSRGVVGAVDDAAKMQRLQIDLLAGETMDNVEHFQPYGLAFHPHPDAELVAAAVGGARSHMVVIAVADRRYRVAGLAEGEVALYDDQGQIVKLARDGIQIMTDKPVTVEAQSVSVTAQTVLVDSADVQLGGDGGKAVARVGDNVDLSTGKIISGSGKVKAA